MMYEIVRQIKEIPELPSEAPKDTAALTHVEFLDEGGIHTFIEGHKYPYKGFPFHEFVEKIDTLKKMGRAVLSSFFHSLKKRNPLQVAILGLSPWLFQDTLKAGIYVAHRIVMRFKVKKERYCTAMRELYRVLSIEFRGETKEEGELREQLRDVLCMILESDNAYRYRFQDIVMELDPDSIRKDIVKELDRLLTIMQSRETGQDLKDTWTLLKKFIPMYLFISPKVNSRLIDVLSSLEKGKIALSKEDRWYAGPRKDYVFGFMLNPDEEDKIILEELRNKQEVDGKKVSIREQSTAAHQEMFGRHKEELFISEEESNKIKEESDKFLKVCQEEGNVRFFSGKDEIVNKVLGKERNEILRRHQQENAVLDAHYNELLQATEH